MTSTMPRRTKTSSKMAKTPEVNISFNASTSRGETGDEAADRVAVEEADVHALEVAKDLRAHVVHDLLAGPLQDVGLDELESVRQDERAQVDKGNLRDPVGSVGAEVLSKPGGRRAAGPRSCSGRPRPWSGRGRGRPRRL